jgi:hypothetical protein
MFYHSGPAFFIVAMLYDFAIDFVITAIYKQISVVLILILVWACIEITGNVAKK